MIGREDLTYFEHIVLGSVISGHDPDKLGGVLALLSPDAFASEYARRTYEVIHRLFVNGDPITEATVRHELGEDAKPIFDVLTPYLNYTDDAAYYARQLAKNARLQKAQAQALRIASTDDDKEARAALDELNRLMGRQELHPVISAEDAAKSFCDRMTAERPEYLKWGFKDLDQKLYAELGDFIIVGGYASSGKTLLSLQFAVKLAEKYRVGFFSLETGPYKLIDRLMSHMSQVPLPKIKQRAIKF